MIFYKKGYVYLIIAETKHGKYWKIGTTERAPSERLGEIQADGRKYADASRHAQLYKSYYISNPEKWERYLHQHYKRQRYYGIKGSGKSEWFILSYPYFAVLILSAHRALELVLNAIFWVVLVGLFFHLIKNL